MIFDLATALVAFAIAVATYPVLIRVFRRLKLGQPVQAELSEAHQRKAGTPTGGGILFMGLALIGGLISLTTHRGAVPATLALVLFGGLGLMDDLRKLRVGAAGYPARVKFPLQVLLAIPVAVVAQAPQHFLPEQLSWLYWPLAVGALVGAANAVNLSDGLDGLAGGLAVIALLGVSLGLPGAAAGEKAVAMTLVGGVLAFLVYNRHPARVFMGDTGALGLGAALAAMAIQQGWVLLLALLGLVFVIETLSVMIQLAFFKVTGGRRIFKGTPIHLTFQQEGWSENRIALTFWSAGAVAAFLSSWIARALA
ncbi:phospho-N-acetylmuramoyl-pentapeptide-transferase [Candidatus Nephthysia bennettiae]|uniref:Phospho-N-acetylmuramoyl-pentapeptide-transferase n=1 Tax=Candidatus Nephthysia bennettiae TaxID=3127016 RepID=A0A934N5G3_9BACT|nr:phospho-N-acetylmuramoyl-pentapeptide-transferase [Candidatus Dormibacteraeota bacterium]MBJ7611362.1 phospho-N-acetylmuramoyl-pentapeptide-transferase [Candidatus Dormibacteraeota bacterium]